MKAVITGSTGFIGTELVRKLKRGGHSIKRLLRPETTAPPDEQDEPLFWEPLSLSVEKEGLEGIDAFFHLSGSSFGAGPWSAQAKRDFVESRVHTTRLVAERLASLEKPPKVLVAVSAVGYYGDGGNRKVNEEDARGDGFLAELCQAWENAAALAKKKGIRVVHARLGAVLSARGGALKEMLPLYRRWLGGSFGGGRQYFPWISLGDAAAALIFLAKNSEIEGAVNLVHPALVTQKEFSKILARRLKRLALIPYPAFLLRKRVGEMADELLLAGQRAVPEVLLENNFKFEHKDLSDCLEDLLNKNSS